MLRFFQSSVSRMARLFVSRKNLVEYYPKKLAGVHDLPPQHLPSPPWSKWRTFRPKWDSFIYPSMLYLAFIEMWSIPNKEINIKLTFLSCRHEYIFLSLCYRRKKIGILATNRWGDACPKFNTPEAKSNLKMFSAEIAPECSIPEIDFNEEGIASHIKTFFVEQRRYRKNKNPPVITKVGIGLVIDKCVTLFIISLR